MVVFRHIHVLSVSSPFTSCHIFLVTSWHQFLILPEIFWLLHNSSIHCLVLFSILTLLMLSLMTFKSLEFSLEFAVDFGFLLPAILCLHAFLLFPSLGLWLCWCWCFLIVLFLSFAAVGVWDDVLFFGSWCWKKCFGNYFGLLISGHSVSMPNADHSTIQIKFTLLIPTQKFWKLN